MISIQMKKEYAIYQKAKDVYEGKISLSDATDFLSDQYNVNSSSFKNWFAPTYRCMINGVIIRGSIRLSLRREFLSNILEDSGVEALAKSLQSYLATIEYYEKGGKRQVGDRALYEEYLNLYNERTRSRKLENIAEELDEIETLPAEYSEGIRKTVWVNVYERNPNARLNAIKYHGVRCAVCNMSFEEVYGEIGKDFIHIHHIVPVSQIGKEYVVNYEKDLIPVCPNCHAMLHRKINGTVLTIKELKNIIKRRDL